jgi:hypothetical protein
MSPTGDMNLQRENPEESTGKRLDQGYKGQDQCIKINYGSSGRALA